MKTIDFVLAFLNDTDTVGLAREITRRLPDDPQQVNVQDIVRLIAETRARWQLASAPLTFGQSWSETCLVLGQSWSETWGVPRVPHNDTSEQRSDQQVRHIIARIATDSYVTITPHGRRKPTLWLYRSATHDQLVYVDTRQHKQEWTCNLSEEDGRDWLHALISRHLAQGAQVDLNVAKS